MHLILKPEDPLNFSHCTGVHVRTLHIEDFIYMLKFKPGLHISTVYKLIRIESSCLRILLLSFPLMPWSSYSCNDRRYSYFIRNICNRYADSFKSSFEHDRKRVRRLLRQYGDQASDQISF